MALTTTFGGDQCVTNGQHLTAQKAELLFYVHSSSIVFPIEIRDKICRECAWSMPTHYRKVRSRSNVSNAECGKILGVYIAKLDELRLQVTSLSHTLTKKKRVI